MLSSEIVQPLNVHILVASKGNGDEYTLGMIRHFGKFSFKGNVPYQKWT